MMRSLAMSTMAIAALAGASQAAVLWDQSAVNTAPNSQGLFNTVSPGFNGSVIFGVSDVIVPAGGWTIQSVSTYYTWGFSAAGTSAVLNVWPKSAGLPTAGDDPRANPTGDGTIVPVSSTDGVVDFQNVREYTASGLNIALAPGEYWIGLTPVQPTGPFGPEFQWSTAATYGTSQAAWSMDFGWPSGWFNYGSQSGVNPHDGAIKITGIPAPGSLALIGLGGLLTARRRR